MVMAAARAPAVRGMIQIVQQGVAMVFVMLVRLVPVVLGIVFVAVEIFVAAVHALHQFALFQLVAVLGGNALVRALVPLFVGMLIVVRVRYLLVDAIVVARFGLVVIAATTYIKQRHALHCAAAQHAQQCNYAAIIHAQFLPAQQTQTAK
jgi:hypothetical protein